MAAASNGCVLSIQDFKQAAQAGKGKVSDLIFSHCLIDLVMM